MEVKNNKSVKRRRSDLTELNQTKSATEQSFKLGIDRPEGQSKSIGNLENRNLVGHTTTTTIFALLRILGASDFIGRFFFKSSNPQFSSNY